MDFPLRMLVPFLAVARDVCRVATLPVAHLHRPRDHGGGAGPAGAPADGGRSGPIKRIAFGISIATASLAGALLIIIQPVEPSVGREYIGRVFAICVLGGLGSLPGTRDRRHAARHRREPHRDVLRPVLGAGGGLRLPAAHAGVSAGRPAGAMDRAIVRPLFLLICVAVGGRRFRRRALASTTTTTSSPATWCCNSSCWRPPGIFSAAIAAM